MNHLGSRGGRRGPWRIYMIFWKRRGGSLWGWVGREVKCARKPVGVNFVFPFFSSFSFSQLFLLFAFYFPFTFPFFSFSSVIVGGQKQGTPLCINTENKQKYVQYVFWRWARLKIIGGTRGVGIFVSFLFLFPRLLYFFLFSSSPSIFIFIPIRTRILI